MPTFDEARFVEEVLTSIKAGWDPTSNLFRVYQLAPLVSDAATIEAAMTTVLNGLGTQRLQRGFAGPVGRLKAGHARAREILGNDQARRQHAEAVRATAEQLEATLADRVAGGPGLPPAAVTAMAAESGGNHTRAEIRESLKAIGAAEREPQEIADPVTPRQWPQVVTSLSQLGQASLWDYVQKTTPLKGVATDEGAINSRLGEVRKRRDAASTAEASLLEILRSYVRSTALVDALRYEVIQGLGAQAAYRFPVLRAATESALPRLKQLGIEGGVDEIAYAVWCRRRFSATGVGTAWRVEYREARAAHNLRRALSVLGSADKRTPDEEKMLKELRDTVQRLDERIDEASELEDSQVERAAELYLQVRSELVDPRIDAGLSRCLPAPPRSVTATADGGTVVTLAWQPTSSRAGRISYAVVRSAGRRPTGPADGVTIAADITTLAVVDEHPPAAQHLHYAVFALREGAAGSVPAHAGPVLIVPEVSGLQLIPSSDSIRARWNTPPQAIDVEVIRRSDTGTTRIADARLDGFVDIAVRAGQVYDYLVRASYRLPDGSVVHSSGLTVRGRTQQVPTAVSRLDVSMEGEDVVVEWSSPELGEVEIREIGNRSIPEARVVPTAALSQIGAALSGVTLRTRTGLRSRPSGNGGSLHLLAVTVLGDLAAIGPSQVIDRHLRPVRNLEAELRGGNVQLTWEWPPEATEVAMLHRLGSRPTGADDQLAKSYRISRATYDALGVRLDADAGVNYFGVCTTSSLRGETSFGPLTVTSVTRHTEIAYRVGHTGLLSRKLVLAVGSPEGPPLPRMQLVANARVRPRTALQGEILLEIDGGESETRQIFVVPKSVGRPAHLRLFATDPSIILRPERPDQLIVD
ncbi:hypothetical protein ACFFOM_13725 [Microlunatus capsulatus]|uniref:SaeA second Fn3-like domain-containing protein n=1 Tax=Microlunatus capsulatus TaxID=99117 RepID=A0ABS4Z894_9ACTN|nr:hypothetical protein [Microlunatus capsulatus]MBP2417194.1 hypothetical protein [Microlunatus capsulatus]